MQVLNQDIRTRQVPACYADLVAQAENIGGLFVSLYNANALEEALPLFASDAELKLPDSALHFCGKEQIHTGLCQIAAQRAVALAQKRFDLHLLHSPGFYVSPDGKKLRIEWDTYSYNIALKAAHYENETMLTRMDVWFSAENGSVRITSLNWHVMQSWRPIIYEDFQNNPLCGMQYSYVPDSALPFAGAGEFKTLQRLANYFVFTHFRNTDELFCGEEDDSFSMKNLFPETVYGEDIAAKFRALSEWESRNDGKYISFMLNANPVIRSDGKTAEIALWSLTMEVKGAAFGYGAGDEYIARKLCRQFLHCRKNEKGWRVKSYELIPVAELAEKKYDKPAFIFDRMAVLGDNFGFEFPDGSSLEANAADCYAVENIVNAWVNGVRRAEIQYFINNYMKASGLPYKFDFKSSGMDAPTFDTPESIYERTKNFDKDLIPRQPAYHTASTPLIVFNADGTHAKACWVDYGNTNMSIAFGVEPGSNNIPYFACGDKYMHSFDKVNGIWYMTHWYFEPMISATRHYFNPEPGASKGWCGRTGEGLFQAPYEDADN